MCNRPWDVSAIVNRPSGINFALEISRNGHTNNGKLIFQQISPNVIKFSFLLLLWHALACFVMLCHPLSSKERDPSAQRNGTPGHKGMGPQGTKAQSIGRPEGRLVPGGLGRSPPEYVLFVVVYIFGASGPMQKARLGR